MCSLYATVSLHQSLMSTTHDTGHDRIELPAPLMLVALAGTLVALLGGYLDDAWHTERGRDDFFIVPHIAIYAGVAATGGALATWVLLAVRRAGLRGALRERALLLALVSVAVTLASAPIDNAWHLAFGRDAVIWSPPHMLGIAGTFGLAAAILVELRVAGGRIAAIGRQLAGAGVVAAAYFTVVEYDTDVPQFDAVWYLPAVALAATVAFSLIRIATTGRWAASEATAVHLAAIAAVAVLLVAVGFDAPGLPLLLPAAVALDLSARRGWGPLPQALALVAAVFVAYVPVRNELGSGVSIDRADVAVGAPVALLLSWLVLRAATTTGWPVSRRVGTAGVTVIVLLALAVAPALAHDPGQGESAGSVRWAINADGRSLAVDGRLPSSGTCAAARVERIVARRAGREVTRPVRQLGCGFSAALVVPERGRWFVYAEARVDDRPVESWLPIVVGSGDSAAQNSARYAYVPPERSSSAVKFVGGVVLYALMGALIVGVFRLARGGASAQPSRT